MSTLAYGQSTYLSKEVVRTFAIASVGGMLEFYDFIIFVFFTQAIGANFFPPETPAWLQQTQVFGLFAAGYFARPLGGLLLAHLGDLSGRKRVFLFSVLLMAVPTFAIGLLPGYAQIGYAAPLLLLFCRVLQGAAIGGEVPGAWVFVSEHAPPGRVGLACGLLTAGLTAGILLGSLVNVAVNLAFSPVEITAYAWRLPFVLGGVLGLLAVLLRRKLAETPVFEALRREKQLVQDLPLWRVVRDHGRALLVSMTATWLLTAMIVVLILAAPSLLRQIEGLAASQVALAGLASTAALTAGCIAVGAAIDRFGLAAVVWIAAPGIPAAAYLLFAEAPKPDHLVAVFTIVGAVTGLVTIVPVVMVRAFPAAVAFSGVSLAYNAAYAVAGGLTPPLAAYLFHLDGLAPAYYVALVSLASVAIIIPWIRSGAQRG